LKRLDTSSALKQAEVGALVALTSFLPARVEPLVYGELLPCATITIEKNRAGSLERTWKARTPNVATTLKVEGQGFTDSPRVVAGLTEKAEADIQDATKTKFNEKTFKAACKRNEDRRWLYPKNWAKWPKTIIISGDESSVCGRYERASCEQTLNMNGLWIRQASGGQPALYLLIKPNVTRAGADRAIISSSISYEDSFIMAEFPSYWQPCDALTDGMKEVDDVQMREWKKAPSVQCRAQFSSVTVQSQKCLESDDLVTISGLTDRHCNMMCQSIESDDILLKLPVHSGQRAQQIIRTFNSFCVAAIQQYVASHGLNFGLVPDGDWNDLKLKDADSPFGTCNTCVPRRPVEQWIFDESRQRWDRQYESGISRKFRLALQNAPTPFEVWVDRREHTLSIKFFPQVAAHYVARQLLDGRNVNAKDIQVQFHFSDTSLQKDPAINPFKVKACDDEEPAEIVLKEPFKLYQRQKKVITKMINIENAEASFEELEMVENPLYGSSGLSLTTQAKRTIKIKGGVIADAIGAGKTVVSIALILNGLKQARVSRKFPRSTSATLIVVPPALLGQWKLEIQKFSPTTLTVTIVYDFATLQNLSLQTILDSDVVLVPIDLLESTGYLDHLIKRSKLGYKKLPKLPTHSGQKEINNALGVWIPATSAGKQSSVCMRGDYHHSHDSNFRYSFVSQIRMLVRTMLRTSRIVIYLHFTRMCIKRQLTTLEVLVTTKLLSKRRIVESLLNSLNGKESSLMKSTKVYAQQNQKLMKRGIEMEKTSLRKRIEGKLVPFTT